MGFRLGLESIRILSFSENKNKQNSIDLTPTVVAKLSYEAERLILRTVYRECWFGSFYQLLISVEQSVSGWRSTGKHCWGCWNIRSGVAAELMSKQIYLFDSGKVSATKILPDIWEDNLAAPSGPALSFCLLSTTALAENRCWATATVSPRSPKSIAVHQEPEAVTSAVARPHIQSSLWCGAGLDLSPDRPK